MAKTDIEKMVAKLTGGDASVTTIERVKELVSKKPEAIETCESNDEWDKPRIYIQGDKYPSFKKREIGETVVLIIECAVKSTSTNERMKDGKPVSEYSMDLVVEKMAEIN